MSLNLCADGAAFSKVSHAQVHTAGSNSARARNANFSESAAFFSTAKTVEPEPLISATPTSGCFCNQVFACARKTNFSKTGRSRSFVNWTPLNSCAE